MVPQLKDKKPKWHTGVLRAPVMDEAPCRTFGEKGVDIIWGGRGGCEASAEGHHWQGSAFEGQAAKGGAGRGVRGPGGEGGGGAGGSRARRRGGGGAGEASERSEAKGCTRHPKTSGCNDSSKLYF